MSSIPSGISRTTALGMSNQLSSQLSRIQRDLADAQEAISTGKNVNRPSDSPAKSSAILMVQSQLDARDQHDRNLDHAISMLNNVDQAVSDTSTLMMEAKSIALSQVGIGSDAATRKTQATVIDGSISALLAIANRKIQDISLFNGSQSSGPAFQEFLGGIRYLGTDTNLVGDTGTYQAIDFNANGAQVFNALSTRVKSQVDLNPKVVANTKLSELNGVLNQGIRKGSILLTVNGVEANVDLSTANTMGDVVLRVQNAINKIDPTAGTIALTNQGFQLTASATASLSIADLGTSSTASDLGMAISAANSAIVAGGDVNPKINPLTKLADLGANVDLVGGLKITHGEVTKIADFSAAATVQDMQNVIQQLNLGLRLEINQAASGFNIVSEVSGIELSIGENSGGTTAGDFGLRTYGLDTNLSDFNLGLGVASVLGQDDFSMQTHDGTSFNVNIDGVSNVRDLIATLKTAAANAGLVVGNVNDIGTDFNLGLATDGNGLVIQDNTAGANDFSVTGINQSQAANDLNINTNARAGVSISSGDTAKVQVDSIFTNLLNLKKSLLNNDDRGISIAISSTDKDIEHLTQVRAKVGVRTRQAQQAQQRSQELGIAEQIMLSDLQEGDMSALILKFTQLQQQLQASLRVGSQNLQLSLLDFLQ